MSLLTTTWVAAQQDPVNYQELYQKNQGSDPLADLEAFPVAPEGFRVSLVAREPVVQNPCAIAFDQRGRIFIGQGPQWRHNQIDSPKDSVVILIDDDGDGIAERHHTFATGFNAIQGLAWRGNDLYVANSPDFTVVRDLDGDDVADEYVRLYTDLGNLEHALHGLNFAPDGRLYMSKGNSKGLMQPGMVAPKPFRELATWAAEVTDGYPDFPEPEVFTAETYKANYQNTEDNWGRHGGILRSQPDGSGLEIISKGLRNPWDMNFTDTFDFLGSDQDQRLGDKFFMPFKGAHFGWNHAWSTDWLGVNHLPSVPAVEPTVDGSTTGVLYYDGEGFPEQYHGFFVGDWLRKVVFFIRPKWEGAKMVMAEGKPIDFFRGGKSLFRPTDMEIGPDGSIYVLSWGVDYGAEWDGERFTNEGRVWRFTWDPEKQEDNTLEEISPLPDDPSISELLSELDHELRVRRVDASAALVNRGAVAELQEWLSKNDLSNAQVTWGLWALAQMKPVDVTLNAWFEAKATDSRNESFNTRLQAYRILGYRANREKRALPEVLLDALEHSEPRIRHAATIAILESGDQQYLDRILNLAAREEDEVVFYSSWKALENLMRKESLVKLLADNRPGVRLAGLLAALELRLVNEDRVMQLLEDPEARVSAVARSYLEKVGVLDPMEAEDAEPLFTGQPFADFIRHVSAKSGRNYRVSRDQLSAGLQLYTDSGIDVMRYPEVLEGASLIQTSFADNRSMGDDFLSFELPAASTVFVIYDPRIKNRPDWLENSFEHLETVYLRATPQAYRIWKADLPAGKVTLGGNIRDAEEQDALNYVVFVKPLPFQAPAGLTAKEAVMAEVSEGNPLRGEWLFMSQSGPACWSCHAVGDRGRDFGPDLTTLGDRDDPSNWIESILEPNAVVTEGFSTQQVATSDGAVMIGTLVEESGLQLSLSSVTGELLRIPKSKITERKSLHSSLMPSYASTLSAQDISDLVAFLAVQTSAESAKVERSGNRF